MNEKKSSRIDLRVWKLLIPYIMKLKKNLIIVLISMLLSSLAEAAYPLFTRYAVNKFVVTGEKRGLAAFGIAFGAIIALEGVTVIFWSLHAMIIEMKLGPALKRDCFIHLQELPISYYSQNSVGYLLARVMSDTDRISSLISWGLSHMLWSLCFVIGTIVYMFILNAALAALLIAILPVIVVIVWLFERRIIVVNRDIRHINSRITGAYNEGITGAKTSKSLVIEEKNTREFESVTKDMYRASIRSSMLSAVLTPLVLFCGSFAVGAALYRGGVLVMEQLLDYGVLSAFISFAVGIITPVMHISASVTDAVSAQACVERVSALLNEPCTVSDTPEVLVKYGGIFDPKTENWETIDGRVTFDHVSFKYPDGDEYVLEDFSLDIPAGTTVAIVGETGAGKSTIVNLACRFYEPTAGRVLIDGRDYRERSQLWLHSSIGYVLQDPHLFSGTILNNIRYGKLDATDDEVVAAAKLVSADIVANKLKDGFDTQVGEGGDMLSTGEKQLVSFARAVISDPPIFVLDEATSSIDTETEALIQTAISHILRGRTSIIIAHRLSTISRSDLILVVDDGKVVERGTHGELMRIGGRYCTLYNAMRIEEVENSRFQ